MYLIDTNVLMSCENLEGLREKGQMIISLAVLKELDRLKTAPGQRGYQARRAVRNIETNIKEITFKNVEDEERHVDDELIALAKQNSFVLVTNDISMRLKALSQDVKVVGHLVDTQVPTTVSKLYLNDEQYKRFEEKRENKYYVMPGEFLAIYNPETTVLRSVLKYIGEDLWEEIPEYENVRGEFLAITSKDIHQACAMHSLKNDEFTVITGAAGTGKTLLAMAHCLWKIEKHGAKVHVFVNPVKTRDTEALGYYPGDRDEKLLQNFIGAILKNKIGDGEGVKALIESGSLNLYPFSDIRGVEIPSGDIMYITEAQNLSIDLIKLAIQRCAEGSQIIIEGDPFQQVDKDAFCDGNNGLLRVIKVFTGDENIEFSHIHLPIIYRSRVARKAEEL